ncbi:MAG: RIP metalloprotease RseP [Aquificae bacterium]|nr:RIP metalloprotease RseP [Aquificota bacterium]
METLIAFLVFIGILVLVHEFGHFIIAKAFGVKVEVFSIGFGPPILRKKIGETVYQIALLPLGGYVKLYGENEEDETARKDPRSFYAKPPWQRILIAFGGPLFNFLFAVLVFWIVFMLPHKVPAYLEQPPTVGYVQPHSLAEKIGIREGDTIVAINGKQVKDWQQLSELLQENVNSQVVITVKRDHQEVNLKVQLPIEVVKKGLGISPYIPPVVGKVIKGFPADQVGLKEGDRILEINGHKVYSWEDITHFMNTEKGQVINLTVERNGKILHFTIVPKEYQGRYLIGIAPKVEYVEISYDPITAFKLAVEKTWLLIVLTVKAIWGLITGTISVKTLGGPLAIAGFASEAAKAGLVVYFTAMATLSVQLGLFNLIPLPLLDGGLILLFLLEWIYGKPLPKWFKEWWIRIGLAIILTLMAFIIGQDLWRFLTTGQLTPSP